MISREVQLKRRPQGTPVPEDFAMAEREVPRPGAGEVMVRNLYMAVDPAICGMISQYNAAGAVTPPRNLTQIMTKRLRLEGYIVTDHLDLEEQFLADVTQWHREGLLKPVETVLEGVDRAVDAFLGLFTGASLGRTLVKLS